MNRDPFLRIGLIVAATGFAAALYALFGWWRALLLATIGVVAAVLVAQDWETPPTRAEVPRSERPRTDSEGRPQDFLRIHR